MTSAIRIVYFAALAQELGLREELIELGESLTVGQLRQRLIARDGPWQALAGTHIKTAVNQVMARVEDPVHAGDEVAFFPPVTGG